MIIKDLIELCPVEEIVSEIMLMYGVDESEREGISRNHTAFINHLKKKTPIDTGYVVLGITYMDEGKEYLDASLFGKCELQEFFKQQNPIPDRSSLDTLALEEIMQLLSQLRVPENYGFELSPWEEILGYEVDPPNVAKVGAAKLSAAEDRQTRKESNPFKRKITDIALLKTIAKYLASVVGNPVSVRSITDYLISNGRKISPNTVGDYVEALTESFIFYPAERFDIVGKQLLKANRKMYIVDLGLRNHILPRKNYDLGFSLENLVYFELLRRGYKVTIGKVGNTEVDFVAQKQGAYQYFQVTADLTAQETFEREIRPLENIRDNYEKKILTMDRLTPGNYNGIQVRYLLDWLIEPKD